MYIYFNLAYHSNKDLLYKDVKLTVHNFGKRFKPYKIIENDNMLKSIVDDYEQRENEAINDLKNRLSKKVQFFLLKLTHILQKTEIELQEVHLLDYLIKKQKIVFCDVGNL